MAVDQPFPRGTFKVESGPGKNEVSVTFNPTQTTIVFAITDPANSLQNIASITQELAASVALVKRKSRKPQESWHWHLPSRPCRNSDKWEGRGRLRSRARDVEPRGFPFRLCAPRIRSTPL